MDMNNVKMNTRLELTRQALAVRDYKALRK